MDKYIIKPRHTLPKLHENGAIISFENYYKLGKIYNEIIGTHDIHHFSINVVDSLGKMSILSYRPQIAYNIFKDGSYRYNGSISETFYNQREIYTWDETYEPAYYNTLKNNMERKNGINKGIVIVRKQLGLTLLYSFATRTNGEDFVFSVYDQKQWFSQMGDYCFTQIQPIIEDRIIAYNLNRKRLSKSNIIQFPNHERS